MKRLLLASALLTASAGLANAATILVFGSTAAGNNITGTENAAQTQTTITGNAPVEITQIISGGTPPITATFGLNATSTGTATTMGGGQVTQTSSGTFSITNGATNYLSGTFTDAVFGAGTGLTLTASSASPGESASFTSSVIPAADLGPPQAISLAFSNVTPGVAIAGSSLASFTGHVSGDFSANAPAPAPEPASLAVLGVGLLGLGVVVQRRRRVN